MSGEVVPFGKYKDKPVEVLLADDGYRNWILSQPWVRERFATFYTTVINYGGPPTDSPEHNQMQAAFLSKDRCLNLAKKLWPSRQWTGEEVKVPRQVVEHYHAYPEHLTAEFTGARLVERSFEDDGWDVTFEIGEPIVRIIATSCPPCTCQPCETWNAQHHVHGRDWTTEGFFNSWAHCDDRCLWKGLGHLGLGQPNKTAGDLFAAARTGRAVFYPNWREGMVRVELKPDLGDDFPAVLRQVKRYPRSGLDRCCVIVRRASFEHVTWPQVVAMFDDSDLTLMFEADL